MDFLFGLVVGVFGTLLLVAFLPDDPTDHEGRT